MKNLIEKFIRGNPLSDSELDKLIEFYDDLQLKTSILGERYHFFWRDAFDNLHELKGFKRARNEN